VRLNQWAYLNQVTLDFSRPGKPTDNAMVHSFNGRLRDENTNRFNVDSWPLLVFLLGIARPLGSCQRESNELFHSFEIVYEVFESVLIPGVQGEHIKIANAFVCVGRCPDSVLVPIEVFEYANING
jgi:hypothetical protein